MKRYLLAFLIYIPFAQAMDAPLQSKEKGKIQTLKYAQFIDQPLELQLYTISHAGSPTELAELMQNLRKTNSYLKNLVEEHASFIIKSYAQNNNKNPMRVISQISSQYLSAKTQHKIQKWHQKGKALIDLIEKYSQYDPEVALSELKVQLNEGTDINYQNNNGFTALMLATIYGHHQIAQALLGNCSKPDLPDNHGATALMLAAMNCRHQTAQALLDSGGVNPDLQGNHGWTALMLSTIHGCHQIVQALLKSGAKPDLQKKDGETALMIAAQWSSPDCSSSS